MKFETVNNYTLYLGLNDKDTYVQIINTDEAENMARDIVTKFVGGATFSKAKGYWVDENQNPTIENTIIIKFSNIDENIIENICELLKTTFNQNCIMIEKTQSMVTFF